MSDHHKGWELLRIANISLVKELAVPYVRSELSGDEEPTITTEGFLKYIMNQKDDFTYAFIVDLVMDIISSIFMYRQGVRENIPSFVFAGRAIFAKIWSARNHPLYRELEMSDSVAFARMPPNMRDFVTKTWSINTSGVKGTGEGPDFKLEEKNKVIQNWIPSVPYGPDWERACANEGSLSNLRKKVFSDIDLKDSQRKSFRQERNLDDEINKFRTTLRKAEYVCRPRARPVMALDGTVLDEELVHLCKLAREKRARFYDTYLQYEAERNAKRTGVPFKETPIFVTKQERENFYDISNRDIPDLKNMILGKISLIEDTNVLEGYQITYNEELLKNRGTKKQDYLNFYRVIEDYLSRERELVVNDNADDSVE